MSSENNNKSEFALEHLDAEDFYYLQKSFVTLFPSAHLCDIMNKADLNFGCYYKTESTVYSSYTSQWPKTQNYWMENDNIRFSSNPPSNSFLQWTHNCNTSSYDSKKMLQEIIHNGVDEEDIVFLKRSYECLQWDLDQKYWSEKVCWVDHPPTSEASDWKTTEKEEDNVQNKSGSARTEGFYRVDKVSLLKKMNKFKKAKTPKPSNDIIAPYSKNYRMNKQSALRDARNDQRRISTAYQFISHSGLLTLNELKFRKKKLRLGKSHIHGLGLFAAEPIPANEMIIEYVGQIIRPILADIREKVYKTSGIGSYCFRIDEDFIIDATKYGNLNRYINHSCRPNSYSKILVMNNKKKIVIYSKKFIKVDEEITYDYKMPFEDDKIACLCGAPRCKKWLN